MRRGASFRIKLTASRIAKGLLAIPKRYERLLPRRAGEVAVLLEDTPAAERKRFIPCGSLARESRIYGLRDWLEQHNAETGDWVEVSPIDAVNAVYRIVFRRRAQEEERCRQAFQSADREDEATEALAGLARAQWRSRRRAALKELNRLAQIDLPRERIHLQSANRYEGAPPFVRVLLRIIYGGRCQVCGFSFRTRNGQPYFEVHHIDPDAGHQPQNLLALCANCHAQMEHCQVELDRDASGWVRVVAIGGQRKPVHHAFTTESASAGIAGLLVLVAVGTCWAVKDLVA